jgi:mRNA-degrading endonuclease RelE of RelBE toxin-antitoxin system
MIFVESPIFTEELKRLLADDDYAALQEYLSLRPEAGDLIKDSGGLRKVRWKTQGRGKRGGVRVIYYYVFARAQIRMLMIYRKGLKDDLSPKERLVLRRLNGHWQQ